MPLVRFEVRNEFRLGDPELYRASTASRVKDGDSKVLLDGVAAAGLVGLLRQLGDLAEFAADIFHDLHEQVTVTAARRRKIVSRIQNIETALPFVEKVIKQQKSHIHFSYVGGSDWHAHIRDNQSVLLTAELPRYMMESYEECHDAPRLYLLDKFDHAGNGACLKRYSDPSYFRRVWAISESEKADNTPRKKKIHSMKRKGSRLRVRELQDEFNMSWQDSRVTHSNSRTRFASSSMDGQSSENSFYEDIRSNPEASFQSTDFDSKARESYAQQIADVNSELADDVEYLEVSDYASQQEANAIHASFEHIKPSEDGDDDILIDSAQEHSVPRSSSVTWDEKTEIVDPVVPSSHDDILIGSVQESETVSFDYEFLNMENTRNEASKVAEILFSTDKAPINLVMGHSDEVISDTDNFVDALNTIESETDTETEDFTKLRAKSGSALSHVSEPQTESNQDKALMNPDLPGNGSAMESLPTVDQEVFPGVPDFPSVISGCVQQPVASLAQSREFSIMDGSSECTVHDLPKTADHEDSDVLSSKTSMSDAHVSMHHESAAEKSKVENSSLPCTLGLPAVQLWTNGVLFGVEPSKPPAPGLVNVSSEKVTTDLRNSASKLPSYMIKPQTLVNGSSEDKSDATLTNNASSSKYHESSSGSQLLLSVHNDRQNDTDGTYLKQGFPLPSQPLSLDKFQKKQETSVSQPPPSITDSAVGLNGSGQSTGIISSAFSDLAHRFLSNTLQRKTLLSTNFTSESSLSTNGIKKIEEARDEDHHMPLGSDSEETSRQSADENPAGRSLHESTFSASNYSGNSSPPLEHMKISFHPLNGMGKSKAKQNVFSSSAHENIDDFLFPSYQLRQDPIDTIQNNFSESDDDTFCKSCPYSSDEPLSPGSYSNSELWEQDERSEHFNDEIFDTSNVASARMDYLTKSPSSKLQCVDAEGHKGPVVSGSSISDLPNLDSLLSVRNQEEGICNLPNDTPCSTEQEQDHSPPLPPPPPAQWRILKPLIASTVVSDANDVNNVSHLDHLRAPANPSEQLENSAKLLSDFEINKLKLNKETNHDVSNKEVVGMGEELLHEIETEKQDRQMLNGHTNLNFDSTASKEVDEHNELLQQIRNKSFKLRRTVTPKRRALPSSTAKAANANVTAMLEKATAIRQAFVSSDETNDDGNWSDG